MKIHAFSEIRTHDRNFRVAKIHAANMISKVTQK
jgi:hypothetical protein